MLSSVPRCIRYGICLRQQLTDQTRAGPFGPEVSLCTYLTSVVSPNHPCEILRQMCRQFGPPVATMILHVIELGR